MPVLHYGTGSSVTLEFAPGTPHDYRGDPQGIPLADPAATIAEALRNPLEYPPLAQITTPGDRVVLALGAGIPQVAQVTAAVVDALMAAGVDADGIAVLRSEADVAAGADHPLRLVPSPAAERIRITTHDPANRRGLGYLAASEGGEPILLNRLLTDADLVLPIGAMQREKTTGYFGIHTAIYPEFSDFHTQARFRKCDHLTGNGHHRDLKREVNHVAWLLGINFALQVVPAAGDRLMHVVAGQSDAVRYRCRELYRETWNAAIGQQAGLVVAAIAGDEPQQTWENFGRVLEIASRLVEPDGAIAVCCDLAAAPGPAMQRLVGASSREAAVRHIRRDSPSDALPALQLAHAQQVSRVYLLSKLDAGLVEELEMVPIDGPDELARLARRSSSCLVPSNASRAMVEVAE